MPVVGNCGESFVDATSSGIPGFFDLYFSLDSSLGVITSFTGFIYYQGSLVTTVAPIFVAGNGSAFIDESVGPLFADVGIVIATVAGFVTLANGGRCYFTNGSIAAI